MLTIDSNHRQQIFAYARDAAPSECCGLIGGNGECASSLYPMRNVAANAQVAYEAAPEDLFAAQRQMRSRSEELLAIYHSHPSSLPIPSRTDLERNYSQEVVNFIISLKDESPLLRGWWLNENSYLELDWYWLLNE